MFTLITCSYGFRSLVPSSQLQMLDSWLSQATSPFDRLQIFVFPHESDHFLNKTAVTMNVATAGEPPPAHRMNDKTEAGSAARAM